MVVGLSHCSSKYFTLCITICSLNMFVKVIIAIEFVADNMSLTVAYKDTYACLRVPTSDVFLSNRTV